MNSDAEFLRNIREYRMITPGDTVLVGVSGGADSMCLLSLMKKYAGFLQIQLAAAHINHCLRGEESDSDEAFVKSYCDSEGILLHILKVDINAIADNNNESTELCARNVRYDYFSSLSPDKIATAHTGSDAVETLLMNLGRGSGLNGLCSIPPVRENIIRPLITFLRTDTECYCRENHIPYITDSSNLSDDYTRNKIRHNVIPPLKMIYPQFESNVRRCINILREDNDFLMATANEVFDACFHSADNSLDLKVLSEKAESIQKRVVALFINRVTDSDYEARHIELITEHIGDRHFGLTLPGNYRVMIRNGLCVLQTENKSDFEYQPIFLDKNIPQTVVFGTYGLTFYTSDVNSSKKNEYGVDFFAIDDIISIRTRLPEDKIKLPKRNCTKTLKKLFTEMKLSETVRNTLPVIADKNGVIAVAGVSVNAERTNRETGKYLIIRIESDKND